MTFSEYFNGLYPYLSDGDKPLAFYDGIIGHFIYEEAQDSCSLLTCQSDTKSRYIKKNKPNKIKPEYAQYAYSKHNPQGYKKWLNERLFQQDSYDRIEEWLKSNNIEFLDLCTACDDLLENIFLDISQPNVAEFSNVQLPIKDAEKEGFLTSSQSANDKELLKAFHIDFDNIIEKYIATNQTDVWFFSSSSAKINDLFNKKWKDTIPKFEDISLQSDVLGTIATLRELCIALDPDSCSVPNTSVRRLRMKLRNNYVKIHPDNYVGVFPYDAFIDDWNDDEEYEM